MKWTYIIKNKLAAAASLFLLCILVLISNFIDRNHTENVKNAISTLYEDRLIAEEYILKMTSGIYQIKEVINAHVDENNTTNSINNLLINIIEENNAYQKTKFTDAEKIKSKELSNILLDFESTPLITNEIKLASANNALVILNELSAIQIDESKEIMANSEKLYLSGRISSQLVSIIIIIILVVLQALVFASKSLTQTINTKSPHLN